MEGNHGMAVLGVNWIYAKQHLQQIFDMLTGTVSKNCTSVKIHHKNCNNYLFIPDLC